MRPCDIEAISALIDGELAESDAARLRVHLEECPSCRALMDDLTAIKEGFALIETDPPDTLLPGILYKAELGDEPSRPRRVIGSLMRVAAIAACVAVVLIVTRNGDLPQTFDEGSPAAEDRGSDSQWAASAGGNGSVEWNMPKDMQAAPPPGGLETMDGDMELAGGGGAYYGYATLLSLLDERGLTYEELEEAPDDMDDIAARSAGARYIRIGGPPFEVYNFYDGDQLIVLYAGKDAEDFVWELLAE
jgi:hypothetical protein